MCQAYSGRSLYILDKFVYAKSMSGKKNRKTRETNKKNYPMRGAMRIILACLAIVLVFVSYKISSRKNQLVCANSITCAKNLSVQIDNNALGIFHGQTVIPPKIGLVKKNVQSAVLGASIAKGPKHIYVDLTNQTLYAYQGKNLVMKTLISSGKWRKTPDGNFRIWVTLRSTRMAGGSGADYYNLPNVPYVMFFYNQDVRRAAGFALHGAYWHDNFGYPMSHGCVNMRITDARALYDWVDPSGNGRTTYATIKNPGTPVTIFGKAIN
ncbi:L,D-transpeptidase [Patescibacteria group bacterium]|nr:L,D-transpeptidase [Patescibacteria group bacterium]